MKVGDPVIYKFLEFPEECGILSKKIQGEPTVYIIRFPYRKDIGSRKQRISIEYLRKPDEYDDPILLEKIYAMQRLARKRIRKYPIIENAVYKGVLTIPPQTVCSLTHMDLEEGEDIIRFNGEEQVFSKKWIENYWNYIDEMTEGECPPKHPITYADMLSQDDIERFTVSLDS